MKISICSAETVWFLIIFFIAIGAYPQSNDEILEIIPAQGIFKVGYTVKIAKDEKRELGSGSFRSIPYHIWYPADNISSKKMSLLAYARISDSCHFIESGSLGFSQWAYRMKADSLKVDSLAKIPTLAFQEADVHAGKFPVIFYASSFRSRPIENFALFEYLASNGFVVIAIPSIGETISGMTMDEQGVRTQHMDLRLAYILAASMQNVDIKRSIAMGFSLGAAPAVLLSLEQPMIKAVISIDGALSYSYHLLGNPDSEKGHTLSVRYLEILQRSIKSQPIDTAFTNLQSEANSSRIQYENMDHYDFASMTLLLKSIRSKDYKPSPRSVELNGINPTPISDRFSTYKSMCRTVCQFIHESIQ